MITQKSSLKLLNQPRKCFEVAGIGIHIQDGSVAVDELIGGEARHIEEMLDGLLLAIGQVKVYDIVAQHFILFDHTLPRLIAGTVGEVEEDKVIIL